MILKNWSREDVAYKSVLRSIKRFFWEYLPSKKTQKRSSLKNPTSSYLDDIADAVHWSDEDYKSSSQDMIIGFLSKLSKSWLKNRKQAKTIAWTFYNKYNAAID